MKRITVTYTATFDLTESYKMSVESGDAEHYDNLREWALMQVEDFDFNENARDHMEVSIVDDEVRNMPAGTLIASSNGPVITPEQFEQHVERLRDDNLPRPDIKGCNFIQLNDWSEDSFEVDVSLNGDMDPYTYGVSCKLVEGRIIVELIWSQHSDVDVTDEAREWDDMSQAITFLTTIRE